MRLHLAAGHVAGVVPVESNEGKVIAYAAHGKIVHVMVEKRKRKLSCTHCHKGSCSHVATVQKYEKDYGEPSSIMECDSLHDAEGATEEKHKYMQLKDGA
jgi:hypothetical protein